MPTTTVKLLSSIVSLPPISLEANGADSIFTDIGEVNDLHAAGIEIEHARRGEDQVKLQPEPVRSNGIGRGFLLQRRVGQSIDRVSGERITILAKVP
jgi:hypothetical protein